MSAPATPTTPGATATSNERADVRGWCGALGCRSGPLVGAGGRRLSIVCSQYESGLARSRAETGNAIRVGSVSNGMAVAYTSNSSAPACGADGILIRAFMQRYRMRGKRFNLAVDATTQEMQIFVDLF